MPGPNHERLIDFFHQRPELAPELLEHLLGVDIPAFEHASLGSENLTESVATEYRADTVVILSEDDNPVLAVVVEVQFGRDPTRHWSWPVYLATVRARLKCPVLLLVVCLKKTIAAWCARPIDLGHPGWTLTPFVIGPDRVPVVNDRDAAIQHPELTMLSAVAHADTAAEEEVFKASLVALKSLDPERNTLYHEFLRTALPKAAQHRLEAMVAQLREYRSDFVRKHVMQGRAEGEANSLLTVLAARGIPVPRDVHARIIGCTDVDQLTTWIHRAGTATSLDDIFASA